MEIRRKSVEAEGAQSLAVQVFMINHPQFQQLETDNYF
jgi:hypothetical protein